MTVRKLGLNEIEIRSIYKLSWLHGIKLETDQVERMVLVDVLLIVSLWTFGVRTKLPVTQK